MTDNHSRRCRSKSCRIPPKSSESFCWTSVVPEIAHCGMCQLTTRSGVTRAEGWSHTGETSCADFRPRVSST